MLKIVALNEEVNSDENNEDEIQVTKEAEETIAVSEYMRALSLKAKGKKEVALNLLKELLETRVLNEISLEDKNDKLFSVRYNCYKNVALIYEEMGNGEFALENFMQAMELDDTEVYTMYRLGQLALELEKWELAQHAFHKCLVKNPNHWPSADGILQALCSTDNIIAAYGWAMKWYTKDENYQRAIDVLTEITEKFGPIIPFFETVWKCSFKLKPGQTSEGKPSVFPQHNNSIEDVIERPIKPNLDEFRVKTLNWLNVAQFITSVYDHLTKTGQCIIFVFTVEDILQEKEIENEISKSEDKLDLDVLKENIGFNLKTTDATEMKIDDSPSDDNKVFVAPSIDLISGSQTPQQSDSNAEDSDNPTKAEPEVAKKPRRRCSDLSFLEQWGWHKNRRYSSRKKSQQDRVETDTTLNGFLRRIFAKFFVDNFDNKSLFLHDTKTENDITKRKEEMKEKYEEIQVSYEEFQKRTAEDFDKFLQELRTQNFDLMLIIFLWLKYVSKYWDQPITEKMKEFYHKIYGYYLKHYDLATWNQLSNDDFNASYRMTLFFMELDHEKAIINSNGQQNEVDQQWAMLYHHLMFNSGYVFVISDDLYERNIIRLIWADYCSAKFENNMTKSVECLMKLETLIDKQPEGFKIEFPNLRDNNFVSLEILKTTRINLQRKISLSNVKNLYDNQQFEDLIEILKDSLINSTEIKNSDNTLMKIQTQFEVLLESLWNVEKYEECMIWSERCLKYAVDNLLAAPTDTYRYKEWAESINFILIYIEELVIQHTYDILLCLHQHLSRLVQSLTKILTHQLDVTFEKNNNPTHPINTKRPWIILHKILQRFRIEDNNPVVIKTKVLETIGESEEDIEELLPHTLLLLFTAHDFLGRRQWCTRDNGQLLLYTLDVIAPKIRTPYMDAYRDLVAEYIEQITYCLYGYPPKKARSRHIEEHDASPVELNWTRAIQLFDLYRPENLPEFNSYKLESISADMEQLLLKILPLIPKDIDPTPFSLHIKDFIVCVRDDLPQECILLPHRISCIYYLLADYYFKNRDFSKTIKYYILDLTCEPSRFDSWAGLALSKASKLETKLNSCTALDVKEFLKNSEDAFKCFEQCIKLNRENTLVWIEYGSFAYIVHSFCSRNLKHSADTLSMEMFAFIETRKEQNLKISHECFTIADKANKNQQDDICNEESDSHDEKWLHHYMLGKIAEKRKESPKVFLDHYLLAANYLYENNATYPIKINHNNPSTLSIEALEIFYRTSSAIIKYLEQHDEISRDVGRLFFQVLKDLSNSPFAYNQAKIDDNSINALKRKLAAERAEIIVAKQPKIENGFEGAPQYPNISIKQNEEKINDEGQEMIAANNVPSFEEKVASSIDTVGDSKSRSQTPVVSGSKATSPSRRGSQESTATTATSTTTSSSTSSSSGSESSSSDSSSSDSESGSSTDDEADKPDENSPLTESELELIYKSCVKNLEECVTRFSEHYKSIHRLVNHYLHAPERLRSLEKCRQLLLGTYTTNLGNQIIGLFTDRKNNNFFNGIWRIPSSEIDRPGSFSSHLVKCVVILLEVLRKSADHKVLIDLALQLHRTPDNDKRYIKDSERKELCQQAISFCVQVMRDILKQNIEERDDAQLLNLIIDIYKVHKKCIKYMNQKEGLFMQLLIDAYKFYIQDKVIKLPENANMIDLAIKLCLQEISNRKNQEKQAMIASQTTANVPILNEPITTTVTTVTTKNTTTTATTAHATTKLVQIPGIPRPRGRPVGSKNSTSSSSLQAQASMAAAAANLNSFMDPATMANFMSLYGNPALNVAATGASAKDSTYFQTLIAEYYKILSGSMLSGGMSPLLSNLMSPAASSLLNPLKQQTSTSKASAQFSAANTAATTSTSSAQIPPKIPQFDIKNLIASAASQVAKSTNVSQSPTAATISIGSGQLTITPTASKSSMHTIGKETSINLSSHVLQTTPSTSHISTVNSTKANASISLTKIPPSSPILSVKPFSELSAAASARPTPTPILPPTPPLSQIPLLPDLPKSLTIIPAPSLPVEKSKAQQLQAAQIAFLPEIVKSEQQTKYTGKTKTSKKSQSAPYVRTQSPSTSFPVVTPPPSATPPLSNLTASLAQQFPYIGHFNLQNYNQQVNLLSAYAELLKSMGTSANPTLLSQISRLTQFPAPTQKRPYTKRTRTSKTQNRFPNPFATGGGAAGPGNISNQMPSQSSSSPSASLVTSTSSKSQNFIPPFNMPSGPVSSKSPAPIITHSPISSPNLQSAASMPSSIQRQCLTPPSSAMIHSSPTKTLQQKLAERQKANALNENSAKGTTSSDGSQHQAGGGGGKRKDIDVIILD